MSYHFWQPAIFDKNIMWQLQVNLRPFGLIFSGTQFSFYYEQTNKWAYDKDVTKGCALNMFQNFTSYVTSYEKISFFFNEIANTYTYFILNESQQYLIIAKSSVCMEICLQTYENWLRFYCSYLRNNIYSSCVQLWLQKSTRSNKIETPNFHTNLYDPSNSSI